MRLKVVLFFVQLFRLIESLENWEVIQGAQAPPRNGPQKWEVLEATTLAPKRDKWEVLDVNSTELKLAAVRWEVMDSAKEEETYKIKNLCAAGLVPFLEDRKGIPRSCNDNSGCPTGYHCGENKICCGVPGTCPQYHYALRDEYGRYTACTKATVGLCPDRSICLDSTTLSQRLCCVQFEYACPMRHFRPFPSAAQPKICSLADLATCPSVAQCMPSSVAGTNICCQRGSSQSTTSMTSTSRSFSAIGTKPTTDVIDEKEIDEEEMEKPLRQDEGCPQGWTPYGRMIIPCTPSKQTTCPGKSNCLRATSTQKQHICCSPGSITVPNFGDRCPGTKSRIELVDGAPRRCSAYSPDCSEGYSCQLSFLRKHMLCCSTTSVRAQQQPQVAFNCPQLGQTPAISQQGTNIFCSNAGQRDTCPQNALCVSAANAAGLLICCFSSPVNVQPICPNNGQPQSSLGGSFVSCDITNPTCNIGFTCVRAANDFQTTLCCSPGTNPIDPICPNQQTPQLTNGRPTYCNPSILAPCGSGFTCTQASNAAGTFICCSQAGTSTCPANFAPQLDNFGNQIFCTLANPLGCPGGSQCLQAPSNPSFFLCCRSSIAPRVCPNGQNALLGPNGNLVSCTGPGAPCSQPNYICTLSPVLAQYYCCGTSTQMAVCADGRETYQQVSGSTYSCNPLQLPTGCPVGYDCAQSSILGTYVCCRSAVTIAPLGQCPTGWNAYRNEVTGETRTCSGPFDMSCPTGYSCTPITNQFIGGTTTFACCRLATTLRCISGQPLLRNNQPRLCSPQQLNQCPPSYTCQQSTVPSITICCTNIPFPLSRDTSLLCPDGSQPSFVGTSVQYCSDIGQQSSCPVSYVCQQNTSGRNLCCRLRRARISPSKKIEKGGQLNDSQWICGRGTIAHLDAGEPLKCADDRDCKRPYQCLNSPFHANSSFCCQRALCPSGVSISSSGRTCQNDGDCGENAQCQRATNIPRVSLCCATNVSADTRCLRLPTQLSGQRPVPCILEETLCDRGYECSNQTSTDRAICCGRPVGRPESLCKENRVPFYVSPSTEKLLFCDDTGYMCPLDFQCQRNEDLDRFICCSPVPECPEKRAPQLEKQGQLRCHSDRDCSAEHSCSPTNVSNLRICCARPSIKRLR